MQHTTIVIPKLENKHTKHAVSKRVTARKIHQGFCFP